MNDHEDYFPTSIGEADRAYAAALGANDPEREWILSDRDVWYRNPYYTGPKGPHPEDYTYDVPEDDRCIGPVCSQLFPLPPAPPASPGECPDIPF